MHLAPLWIKNKQILLFVKKKLHVLGRYFSHLVAKCTKLVHAFCFFDKQLTENLIDNLLKKRYYLL